MWARSWKIADHSRANDLTRWTTLYSLGNTFYDCDEAKEGTARRHLHAALSDNVDTYSFEVEVS